MATTTEISRHDLLTANPELSGWAAIASSRGAIAEYLNLARNKVEVPNRNIGQGKRAVIIGAGVAGLTSAYELYQFSKCQLQMVSAPQKYIASLSVVNLKRIGITRQ